jgi:hypothetical protein
MPKISNLPEFTSPEAGAIIPASKSDGSSTVKLSAYQIGDLATQTAPGAWENTRSTVNTNSAQWGSGSSKWTEPGGAITYLANTGNKVGIGEVSPKGILHLGSRGTQSAPTFDGTTEGLIFDVYNGGNPYPRYCSIIAEGYGDTSAELSFWTTPSSSSATSRMTINNDGRVGINTTAPSTRLHVEGDVLIEYPAVISSQANSQLILTDSDTPAMRLNVMVDKTADTNGAVALQSTEVGVSNDRSILLNPHGGNVGIGAFAPNANAVLDVASTTKAFMPPRMTTTQRDAIASPGAGMVVYNSTTNVLNFHNGSAWAAV